MPRAPLTEFISLLRRFDGTTNTAEFFTRFKADVADNGYTAAWAISNIDRVLDGDAKNWFEAKWPLYSARLANCRDADDYEVLLNQMETDFIAMFDKSSQTATWRAQNKACKFYEGEDAQHYVTQKMRILRYIDSEMSESRKVQELINGLPINLRMNMVCLSIKTCEEFVAKLRQIAETLLLDRNRRSSQSRNSFDYSNVTMAKLDDQKQRPSKSSQFRTPNGKPICFYCNKPGHVRKVCRALKADQSTNQNDQTRDDGRQKNRGNSRYYNRYSNQKKGNWQNENLNSLEAVDEKVEQVEENDSMHVFHSFKASNSKQDQGN